MLIDSGFRCHLTSFARATAAAPSPFVARLRKYLKTRRVTSVSQVGTDRIIEIQFSDGAYRLFLEFYAGGNIVLTDNDLSIIGLLRNVDEGAEHEKYRLGLTYNLSLRQNYNGVPELTKERVRNGLQKAVDRQADEPKGKASKMKKKPGDALRKALAVSITEFPPIVIDHAMELLGFDKTIQPAQVIQDDHQLDALMQVLEQATKVLADITSAPTATGYIVAKRSKQAAATNAAPPDDQPEPDSAGLMYDDFHPFKPKQLENNPENTFLDFVGFNKTVDEFFSSIEGQKLESKLSEREENAKKRIEQARQEHAKRIDGLQQVQELNVLKAQAIEANLDRVEEAAAAVNGLIAQGMDWVEISRLIEMEQSRHNPVAEMIKLPLKLEENTATLLLSEYSFEEEEEDMADETDSEPSDSEDEDDAKPANTRNRQPEDKRLHVDIDLSLSGWSNARQYYDQRKTAATKQERTEQASTKALKSTEAKIQADLRKGLKQEKQVLRPVRKQNWFEKFIYFLSSDGYLVLGAKDAQQSEILYRRYLKKGDIYVHADLPGACPVIIKNNPNSANSPIPPSTLSQAGNMSVCTSNAWDSKAIMSAWWAPADQVSKTGATGEYLAAGAFNIRGKKNFLPPAQLLLGFGILFEISEESKANHNKLRVTDGKPSSELQSSNATTADDDDDDDDFPDAGDAANDSDEDFPDAGTGDVDGSDDDEPEKQGDDSDTDASPHNERANPLQSGNKASPSVASEAATHAEDDDQSEPETSHETGGEKEIQAKAKGTDTASDQQQQSGIRHLSARERRLQRKEAAAGADSSVPGSQGESSDKGKGGQSKSNPPANKPNQPVRGKRGKSKKAAAKYADQDDEDRRIAMELLGSRAADERREAAVQEQAVKKETEEEARARRRAQHEKSQREGLEAEKLRKLTLEEGIDENDDEESSATTQLDALVGTPFPGDDILGAIPVCAPFAALGNYKYKVKLQPGTQKKGKAVREILDKWNKVCAVTRYIDVKSQDKERIWPREAELIKGFKEVEVVGVVPVSKVRLMISGGALANSSGGASGGPAKKKSKRSGRGSKKVR